MLTRVNLLWHDTTLRYTPSRSVMDMSPLTCDACLQAAYIRVPPTARAAVKAAGLPFRDGLHAASHAVLNVLPAYIM